MLALSRSINFQKLTVSSNSKDCLYPCTRYLLQLHSLQAQAFKLERSIDPARCGQYDEDTLIDGSSDVRGRRKLSTVLHCSYSRDL